MGERWQVTQERLAVRGRLPFMPPTCAALLIDHGRWSVEEALARTRRPRGDWRPRVLETLAARLDQAAIERLLADERALPQPLWIESAPGFAGLLLRLGELAGPARALTAWRALPDSVRVLLAPTAVTLARAAGDAAALPRIVEHAVEHAGLCDRVVESAEILFGLLPLAPAPRRVAIIDATIERVYDEDFPITAAHWRSIAAVDMPRARAVAYRERLAYPRAWRLAAISWHLSGSARERALADWLVACEELVADGFSLRGNVIPTPLPPVLLASTLELLRRRAHGLDRAYVLLALAPAHPELRDEAAHAVARIHRLHRALAWILHDASFDPAGRRARARECVATLRGTSLWARVRGDPEDFWNLQRAWLGWEAETLARAEWCARAIAMLPLEAAAPALDGLLEDLARGR